MQLKVKNNTIPDFWLSAACFLFAFFLNLILKVTLLLSTETSLLAIVEGCEIGRARKVYLRC